MTKLEKIMLICMVVATGTNVALTGLICVILYLITFYV